ncbi:MAG: hypothetical protein ACHQNE_08545 [Candidatus Kapaibacterium sp.]
MRVYRFIWAFAVVPLLFCPSLLFAQGMTLDSLLPRIGTELHNPALAEQLHDLIPDFANVHVWGLAMGDFTNDSLPDLAISLYDPGRARSSVRVYLFENIENQKLANEFEREIPFVESPMEVGLSIDSSVVTITQKIGEDHWTQEGYSIVYGDLTLTDRFETQQENLAGAGNGKPHPLGHEVYRNYRTLRTRESYFTGTAGGSMLSESYFTLPAYGRLREIYPGYGHILSDSSKDFITQGQGLRRDVTDFSIRSMQAAYDDDYLYIAVRVRDDYVTGGQPKDAANDRVSFWFDTKYTGDRLNRDRRILSEEGGFPTFRTALDSLVSNITFVVPAHPGKVTQVTYSTVSPLTPLEQEGLSKVRAVMEYDTDGGNAVNGYQLTLKIPFSFLGFETNPEHAYETPVPIASNEPAAPVDLAATASITNAATLGFTALVYDVDDPARPNEVTVQATSHYEAGNPSTFGTLVLEPSALYYGEVHPTYLDMLRKGLVSAGY